MDPLIGGPSVDQANPGVKEVEGFNFFSRLNGFEADNPARPTAHALHRRKSLTRPMRHSRSSTSQSPM